MLPGGVSSARTPGSGESRFADELAASPGPTTQGSEQRGRQGAGERHGDEEQDAEGAQSGVGTSGHRPPRSPPAASGVAAGPCAPHASRREAGASRGCRPARVRTRRSRAPDRRRASRTGRRPGWNGALRRGPPGAAATGLSRRRVEAAAGTPGSGGQRTAGISLVLVVDSGDQASGCGRPASAVHGRRLPRSPDVAAAGACGRALRLTIRASSTKQSDQDSADDQKRREHAQNVSEGPVRVTG